MKSPPETSIDLRRPFRGGSFFPKRLQPHTPRRQGFSALLAKREDWVSRFPLAMTQSFGLKLRQRSLCASPDAEAENDRRRVGAA
jgi:hypothetical protein